METLIPFTNHTLLMDPAGPTREYQPVKDGIDGDVGTIRLIRQMTPQWGQMKLLLHELWFFTHYADPIAHARSVVIYVGAAEGTHIPFLVQMFPWISQWHLYDPRPFTFDQPGQNTPIGDWSSRVFLHTGDSGKFTNDVARQWLEWTQQEDIYIFFISDIRDLGMSNEYTNNTNINKIDQLLEANRLIKVDMDYQQEWYQILQPRIAKASLKFRLPYPFTTKEWDEGGRTEENPYDAESYYDYLYGYMYRQPFSKPGSTETRLVPDNDANGNIRRYSWKLKLYDELLYQFTSVQRPTQLFPYPQLSDETMAKLMALIPEFYSYNPFIKDRGISWDMAAVIFIVSSYMDYANFEMETGLVPFIWAMMTNLNVVGYNRPTVEFVKTKGEELYREWNQTAVTLTSLTGITGAWHPRAGTTWQLFLGQNVPNQNTLGVYRISPKDIEIVQRGASRQNRGKIVRPLSDQFPH